MSVCIYMCVCVCVCFCMFFCILHVNVFETVYLFCVSVYVCVCIKCVFVCMCVCVCVIVPLALIYTCDTLNQYRGKTASFRFLADHTSHLSHLSTKLGLSCENKRSFTPALGSAGG